MTDDPGQAPSRRRGTSRLPRGSCHRPQTAPATGSDCFPSMFRRSFLRIMPDPSRLAPPWAHRVPRTTCSLLAPRHVSLGMRRGAAGQRLPTASPACFAGVSCESCRNRPACLRPGPTGCRGRPAAWEPCRVPQNCFQLSLLGPVQVSFFSERTGRFGPGQTKRLVWRRKGGPEVFQETLKVCRGWNGRTGDQRSSSAVNADLCSRMVMDASLSRVALCEEPPSLAELLRPDTLSSALF